MSDARTWGSGFQPDVGAVGRDGRPPIWGSGFQPDVGAVGRDGRPPAGADIERLIAMGVSLHKSIGAGLTLTLLMPRSYAAGHVPDAVKLEEILAVELRRGGARNAAGEQASGCVHD